jgi:hypothetical protein
MYYLLYYTYYLSDMTLLSPLYTLVKYSWMAYKWKTKKKKPSVIILNQTYDSEEDYVNIEMTELS